MATETAAMAHPDLESLDETSNSLLHNTRCCFCFPCFGSQRQSSTVGIAWWQRIRTGHIQSNKRWWAPAITAFQKVREWSEIVAGPKWKTFIRRFNRSRSNNSNGHHHQGKFQYDALSYSLNFDEDANLDDDDDFSRFRNFSSRYASSKPTSTVTTAGGGVDARGKDVAVLA
ncbi:NHL domain protein [Melia azedarach]|uniref:NHL domain protein n=1 Tax=Melia azedarach TaxID=155640 RepID=A0ACC1XM32_MELAZ|nr:NHL domain protein [Melia azedarach]